MDARYRKILSRLARGEVLQNCQSLATPPRPCWRFDPDETAVRDKTIVRMIIMGWVERYEAGGARFVRITQAGRSALG
jgi:hypothetical protein